MVSEAGEIDPSWYQKPGGLTHRGIRNRGDLLSGVSDPGKSCFAGVFTPQGLTPWKVRFFNLKF